jgi:hypothetical protein
MAGSALITKRTFMSVILGVTGSTVHGCAFELAVDMTARTGNRGMFSVKVEGKLRMIYICRFPASGRMTGRAISSQLTFMSVILLMTGETILRSSFQVSNGTRVDMTGRTFHSRVLPDQIERNFIMVEVRAVRVYTVMASHAVRPECQEVLRGKGLVNLQVAVPARSLIERRGIATYMAVFTSCSLVRCQFE